MMVNIEIKNLKKGIDRVLVAPSDSNHRIDYEQLRVKKATKGSNFISVSALIAKDTPHRGIIRVEENNGGFKRLQFSAWSNDSFYFNEPLNLDTKEGNKAFIAYIDEIAQETIASKPIEYIKDKQMFIRVRDLWRSFECQALLSEKGLCVTVV